MGAVFAIIVVGVAIYAIATAMPLAAVEDAGRELPTARTGDGTSDDDKQASSDRAGCAHQAFRLSASSQSGTVPSCIDNGELGQPAR